MTPVLQTDRLGKRYRRRCALQDCTLAIPEGKVVGLVGPNGAGKTTLLLVLSSHLLADLERVCDYLVVLVASHVQLTGDVDELLASHHRLTGPRRDPGTLPGDQDVIEESHSDKQTTLLVRTVEPIHDPAWTVKPVTLDDLVLAYLGRDRDATPVRERGLRVAS